MMSCCACSKEERPENADKTINFHLQEDPSSIDPQITSTFGARVAVEALFEGLVRLDEEGNPYPGAAESWEVSSDGLRYTFHLRKDAKWSKSVVTENGETSVSSDPAPLTARDFVYGWQRAVNPSTECPEAASFSIIKNGEAILNGSQSPEALGVEAVDDHTLVVTLENPSDDFLSLTAMAAFMPCQEDFFLWTSGRYGLEAKYICGNGPFAFYNSYAWDHEEGMKLRRSGSYVGENEVLPAALELYVSEKAVDVSDPVAAVTEERVDLAPISSEQVDKAEFRAINQKAIASSCEIEPATVGSILSRMERDGLVRRRQRNGDRRSLYVSLTPRGDALGRQMMELFHQADTRAAALLSPQEQAQLLSLLNKVCTAVQPEEEAVQ